MYLLLNLTIKSKETGDNLIKYLKIMLILAIAASFSCAQTKRAIEIPKTRKVLILDLQKPEYLKSGYKLEGWWFGSKDVFETQDSGRVFSDNLESSFDRESFNVYSRTDLKYFILEKKEKLKNKFPDVSEEKLMEMINQASPVDFGKELQADIVITGKVVECNLVHNRTVHWWRSLAEVEIEVYDVAKNEKIMNFNGRKKKLFYSTNYAIKKLSEEIAKDIKESLI